MNVERAHQLVVLRVMMFAGIMMIFTQLSSSSKSSPPVCFCFFLGSENLFEESTLRLHFSTDVLVEGVLVDHDKEDRERFANSA